MINMIINVFAQSSKSYSFLGNNPKYLMFYRIRLTMSQIFVFLGTSSRVFAHIFPSLSKESFFSLPKFLVSPSYLLFFHSM